MKDLLVVGAGLTGLYAASLAARRGARTMLLAFGRGGLEISSGCIHVWNAPPPRLGAASAHLPHPYALLGTDRLEAAITDFLELMGPHRLDYLGSLDDNHSLLSCAGGLYTPSYAPASLAGGDLKDKSPLALGWFPGFRDFSADLAAGTLQVSGIEITGAIELPLPGPEPVRNLYSTDLARRFDDSAWRAEAARAWKPRLLGVRRLGLPAVIGMRTPLEARQDLEQRLEATIFEIPTLPPCVPGLRLEGALRRGCAQLQVDLIEGARIVGRVDGRSGGRRVSGLVAQTAGGARAYDGKAVLLATGDLLHGGLVANPNGRIQESVFDLPVVHQAERSNWTAPSFADPQPYAAFGLRVDEAMRPLDAQGQPAFENLFAAGGLLAGARRAEEGSRQGIDLASAHRAVEAALS